jgi:hypothetical protein
VGRNSEWFTLTLWTFCDLINFRDDDHDCYRKMSILNSMYKHISNTCSSFSYCVDFIVHLHGFI